MSDLFIYWSLLGPLWLVGPPSLSFLFLIHFVVITSHGTRLSTTHKQHTYMHTKHVDQTHNTTGHAKKGSQQKSMISTQNTKKHVKHQGTKMEGQVL